MVESERYQLVLERVPDERQPAAAIFLSACFSLPPTAATSIAASGPIALVSGLGKAQAEAVLAELSAAVAEGVSLRMEGEEGGGKVSRLQWPRPPKIYGKDLAEFGQAERAKSHEDDCPLCGGRLTIEVDDRGGVKLSPARRERVDKAQDSRVGSESDKDPLFSGVKPLADATGFASLRSLQAGDTGFWADLSSDVFAVPGSVVPPNSGRLEARLAGSGGHPEGEAGRKADASGVGRRAGKTSAGKAGGLAAFMKPGAFAVVVARTRDGQAVKMIAEIMGISEDEARERGLNLGLCVARDISLDEAQNLLARFKSVGVGARIVKPM